MEEIQRKIEDKRTSGARISNWLDTSEQIRYQPLRTDIKVDVVIVGGGIAGVSTAFALCKAGRSVALVEDGYIGSGETGRTTAHLVAVLDDRFYELERIFGKDSARLAAQSHLAAIDFIERVVLEENISCGFTRVDGYLFPDPSDDQKSLEDEFVAATNAGLMVERVNVIPGMLDQPVAALKFPRQAQFHPMQYLQGLCAAIIRLGGQIFTETHADIIDKKGVVTENGNKIEAEYIVVATNSPVNNILGVPLKQFPYRTYVIGAKVEKGKIPKALWWDTGNFKANSEIPPYHYVRTAEFDEAHDLLIIGGEDHATGLSNGTTEEKRYANLEQWGRAHFPMGEVIYRWSGQVQEPMDSLAYIGRSPGQAENVLIVSGDSGNGMTYGVIAGMLISDIITGKENPWKKIYEPSRFNLFKSGKTFFKELVTTFINYTKTYPLEVRSKDLINLKQGEAKIIRVEGKKCGVYRDEADILHIVDPVCTHLNCIVSWNGDEKSWDCPCHGSRFSHEGKVITGPANQPLDYHKELYSDLLSEIKK